MFVSVSLEEWSGLQAAANKLAALEAAGVDNWEGYDEAMRTLHEEELISEKEAEDGGGSPRYRY
jgi:hypothetical protein